MSDQQETDSFLSGYRVLDLTDENGLLCSKILGDLGADVIKIEPPGGSPSRNLGPFYKDVPDPEKSLFWFAYNTSKRGITLNIEKTDGKALFKNLVRTADIVVESFLPGYMDELGLGYTGLSDVKPDIIMTSITPFGQTGPFSQHKGADIVGWAMGGMMGLCGDDDRPPVQHSHPQSYYHAGVQGAVGTMVALYHKEMRGEGQHVDVSMQQAVVLTLMNAIEYGDLLGVTPARPNPDGVMVTPRPATYGPLAACRRWACKDGYITWIHLLAGGAQPGMVHSTKEIVKWMEEEGMAGDLPEFDWTQFDTATVSQDVVDHQTELFREFFLTKTKRQLMDRAASRGILLGAFQTTKDIVECPQLAARDFFVDVEHPELEVTMRYPGAWAKVSEAPWRIGRRAPRVGEHNEEIYGKEMGLSKEALVALKGLGVI
jgi:crotonobetainyl-CoA:carnitine CoA-transferase CaiB-like acyl-CoA transferase